nr:Glu/Leu/Phe/Val dehydrogenase dimerization domain-containing protein [Candidatus Omnitrophota bacterium]
MGLDDGTSVEIWGFRALHNGSRGAGKGGLRWLVAKDETPEDAMKAAVGLATLMSIKNSGVGIPYGGGKGDIFVPDRKYTDSDKARIVRAFSRELTLKEAVGTFQDVPAPDKGTDARMMAWFLDEHIRTLLEMGKIHDKLLQEELRKNLADTDPGELVQSDEKTPYLDIYIDVLENDDTGVLRGVELGVITGKPLRKGKKVQLGSLGRTKATGRPKLNLLSLPQRLTG